MKLYVFNPEHDIALARNIGRFTPPRAARELRESLDFLPLIMAGKRDLVLAENPELAMACYRDLGLEGNGARCISPRELPALARQIEAIAPWGWDRAIVHELTSAAQELAALMPTDEALQTIRQLSHRRFAAERLVPELNSIDSLVHGKAICFEGSAVGLAHLLSKDFPNGFVLKQPWSSTGRGVRMATALSPELQAWAEATIRHQGSIMVEPLYNKVADFGMEFQANADGSVDYCGLSLFETTASAYGASLIDTEDSKEQRLAELIPLHLIYNTRARLLALLPTLLRGNYVGPFGIDMMVVLQPDGSHALVPCVELNLRCTMGHVALAIARQATKKPLMMRIVHERLQRLFQLKLSSSL